MNNEQIILGFVTCVTALMAIGFPLESAFAFAMLIAIVVVGFDGG